MAYINIDVELDEFDLHEILQEIEFRYSKPGIRGKSNKDMIDDFIKKMKIDFEDVLPLANMSLVDKMKFDFLTRNLEKITLNDLRK